jgi:hypothetical protein
MLVPGRLLLHAVRAMLASQAALDNTAAVAGLASALTSLAKRQCSVLQRQPTGNRSQQQLPLVRLALLLHTFQQLHHL